MLMSYPAHLHFLKQWIFFSYPNQCALVFWIVYFGIFKNCLFSKNYRQMMCLERRDRGDGQSQQRKLLGEKCTQNISNNSNTFWLWQDSKLDQKRSTLYSSPLQRTVLFLDSLSGPWSSLQKGTEDCLNKTM